MHTCCGSFDFSYALQVAAVVEAGEDAFFPFETDLGEGARPDIEEEIPAVFQPQEMADEKPDYAPVGEGDDGPGGIGSDPAGRRPDPSAKGADALAVGEGEIVLQRGPAIDGAGIGCRDLGEIQQLPTAEVDLPEVVVDCESRARAKRDFGGFPGSQERTAEEMRPPETADFPGQCLCLALPLRGERDVCAADIRSAVSFSQIAVTDENQALRHRSSENKKSPRLSTWGCRISSSTRFRSATPLREGQTKQDNLRAGLLASGSSSGRAFPFLTNSDVERPLSPVTAAGPRRTRTVFPVARKGDPQGYGFFLVQPTIGVKGNEIKKLDNRGAKLFFRYRNDRTYKGDDAVQEIFELQSDVCKVFANPKRLEIINHLKDRELSAGDLIERTGLSKANLSQHMGVLKAKGVIVSRREGVTVYYRISKVKIIEACVLMREVLLEQLQEKGRMVAGLNG